MLICRTTTAPKKGDLVYVTQTEKTPQGKVYHYVGTSPKYSFESFMKLIQSAGWEKIRAGEIRLLYLLRREIQSLFPFQNSMPNAARILSVLMRPTWNLKIA